MGKIIAISNQKGGVGKTTTAVNLACGLVKEGKNVLLVDLDAQANASSGLNCFKGREAPSIYDALLGGAEPAGIIIPADGTRPAVLPSNINLAGADLEIAALGPGQNMYLKKILEPLKDQYDFILIDCPPSLGLLNNNALTAADSVLIPVQCEYYALEGITQLLLTIRMVQTNTNPDLKIEGILMTMFDIRTRLSVDVSQEARRTFGRVVYQNSIPRNVKLSEAPSRGISIFEYDPRGNGAKAYKELVEEFLRRNREGE